jgi:mRNA interferase MazF
MVTGGYVPEHGDIIWLNFDPQTGHEQKGKRPALVISPKAYNAKVGLALFCPITSHEKQYPFEVKINNSTISGVVLSDQIKSLDWRIRNAIFVTNATKTELAEVVEKISVLLAGE